MEERVTELSPISWLAKFASKRWLEFLLSVILALAGVACSLFPYFIMMRILSELLNGNDALDWYLMQCLYMGIFWLGRYLLHALSTTLSHHATFYTLAEMRRKLLKKLATLPLGAVQEMPSGSYKNIIVEKVDAMETSLAHLVPEMSSNLLGAIAMLILIFVLDWRMGLAMLIVLPLGLACFAIMMRGYGKMYQNTIVKTKALNDTAVEYINGIEVIKAFGQSKSEYQKFETAAKEGADCYIDWMRNSNFGQTAGMTIFPSTLLGVLPIGCLLYVNGTLSAAMFISIIIMSFAVMQPLMTAFSFLDDLSQVQYNMNEISSILNKKDMERPLVAKELPKDNSIELKDVHFSYGEEEVLHGISLDIRPGSVNALVGPSGSGKSTIAKLIASLWDVDEGYIKLGGVNLKDLPLNECVNRISYVSQDNYLFDMSVIDNIKLGKKGATEEEAIEACKRCGCHDFILSLENGYQTMCGSSGSKLSGGEKQRISIARAMLKDAPIIVLDEATSYTDPENEATIQSSLARLTKGKTLIVIAHRLSTIKDADKIFVIQNGNVLASGRHEDLLKGCQLYQNMWEAHISVKDSSEERNHD